MIWDLHLVHKMEHLRFEMRVPVDVAHRLHMDEIKQLQARDAEHKFRDAAHTLGVDLDSRDLHFRWEEEPLDEVRFCMVWRLEVRWWPEVREVQLVGGPADGTQLVLDEATFKSGQLRVHVAHRIPPFPEPSEKWPTSIPSDVATYRIMGWHEHARFWTMQPI